MCDIMKMLRDWIDPSHRPKALIHPRRVRPQRAVVLARRTAATVPILPIRAPINRHHQLRKPMQRLTIKTRMKRRMILFEWIWILRRVELLSQSGEGSPLNCFLFCEACIPLEQDFHHTINAPHLKSSYRSILIPKTVVPMWWIRSLSRVGIRDTDSIVSTFHHAFKNGCHRKKRSDTFLSYVCAYFLSCSTKHQRSVLEHVQPKHR